MSSIGASTINRDFVRGVAKEIQMSNKHEENLSAGSAALPLNVSTTRHVYHDYGYCGYWNHYSCWDNCCFWRPHQYVVCSSQTTSSHNENKKKKDEDESWLRGLIIGVGLSAVAAGVFAACRSYAHLSRRAPIVKKLADIDRKINQQDTRRAIGSDLSSKVLNKFKTLVSKQFAMEKERLWTTKNYLTASMGGVAGGAAYLAAGALDTPYARGAGTVALFASSLLALGNWGYHGGQDFSETRKEQIKLAKEIRNDLSLHGRFFSYIEELLSNIFDRLFR